MHKPKEFTKLVPVLIILIVFIGLCFFISFKNKKDIPLVNNQEEITPTQKVVTCEESPKYFILLKSLASNVGTDILVKYKKDTNEKIPCIYKVNDADFEIKNDESAQYFFHLTDKDPIGFYPVAEDLLILESGTGPTSRGITIYNLISRKKVFNDTYSGAFEILNYQDGNLIYWVSTNKVANENNCKEFKEYSDIGQGIVIDSHVVLDLSKLTKKDLNEYRCHLMQ